MSAKTRPRMKIQKMPTAYVRRAMPHLDYPKLSFMKSIDSPLVEFSIISTRSQVLEIPSSHLI